MEKQKRKDLIMQYKQEKKTTAGIYAIKNKKNGKVFLLSTPNFDTINGKKAQLRMGSFGITCKELQDDWKQLGEEAFEFEILEEMDEAKRDEPFFDIHRTLKDMLQKWLDKMQPYGDKGYN